MITVQVLGYGNVSYEITDTTTVGDIVQKLKEDANVRFRAPEYTFFNPQGGGGSTPMAEADVLTDGRIYVLSAWLAPVRG